VPRTEVVFYAEADGRCPVLRWLDRQHQKVQDKCFDRLERLAELGFELRRPDADMLEDGIYELRASYQGVHHRILYFFHQGVAVLVHGLKKERRVPPVDIRRAKERRERYERNPVLHTLGELKV